MSDPLDGHIKECFVGGPPSGAIRGNGGPFPLMGLNLVGKLQSSDVFYAFDSFDPDF